MLSINKEMDLHIKKLILIACTFLVTNTVSASTIAEQLLEIQLSAKYDEEKPVVRIRKGQAKALQSLNDEKYKDDRIKLVLTQVEQLTDRNGLTYLGGKISKADLVVYLEQLKLILGSKYKEYRHAQAIRDKNEFHVTLVTPNEFALLDKESLNLTQKVRVSLVGLGRVSIGNNTSYFVVANSDDAKFYRQNLQLKPKDFHVTLGFQKSDVHGVSKNISTLISP